MRRLFLLIIAALPVPALAAPATTKAVIPADLEAQVAQGRDHCRKAVYRYYSQIPMGPKRGFSISDVNVEVNQIVFSGRWRFRTHAAIAIFRPASAP